jgi:putative hemolysin
MLTTARRWSLSATWLAALLPIATVAIAQPDASEPAADCTASAQWQAGLAERASSECAGEGGEAFLLARELARLRADSRAIEQTLSAAEASDSGAARRRLRQLRIDIEAIEAEARVRGWSGG